MSISAAGRPVVSTPLDTLRDLPDVAIAADAREFAARLQEEVSRDSPDVRAARSRRADPHSWESRLQEIASALGDA